MEGSKQEGGSNFSFNSDVFGSSGSSSSLSPEIFGSMFSPSSSKEVRRETLWPEEVEKKQNPGIEISDSRAGPRGLDNNSRSSEDENHHMRPVDKSSYYQQESVQPCHLSCSIYYGGQEIYSQPSNSESNGLHSTFKKDGDEDDVRVSRGNWWKGSLYY